MTFIEDKEINLYEEDILQTKPYAESLKNTILTAPTPFNIGLYGEWGSGKSSIICTVQKELESDSTQKIKFVVYDAWKYANDSFRRMFLKTLQEQLQLDGTELFDSFYQSTSHDKKIEQKFNGKYLWLILGFGFISIILTFLFSKSDSTSFIISLQAIFTLMTALIAFFKNAFIDYKLTISKPALFAPEQFEEAFNEFITVIFDKQCLIHPFRWIKEKKIFEKSVDKLVIVIDNIDRCDKKTAYELLTNIKNFVSKKEGIIFLIPVDDEALKRHMQEHNKENGKEADEFLRKFFNTTLKIKHFQPRDLFEYADSLNQKFNLGFNPDTINIVAKEYASNPRRIIQFFNNLTTELNALESKHQREFCEKNQSLIAKLLIIREEWSDIFKKITEQPHLFNEHTEIDYDKEEKNEKLEFERFKQFMQKTRAIGSEIQTIEQIVLNITNGSTLSTELTNLLEVGDEQKLLAELENDHNYKKVIHYIVEELRKSIHRKVYTDALNNLVLLSNINNFKTIHRSILGEISGFFYERNDIISTLILSKNNDLEKLFQYIETNRINGFDYLQNHIVSSLQDEWSTFRDHIENIPSIWLDGFEYIINFSADEKMIKELQPAFFHYYGYFEASPIYENKWINENKLSLIVSDQLVNYLINKIDNPIDADKHTYKELFYFSEHNLVNAKNIENLFLKIKPNFSQQIVITGHAEQEKQKYLKEIYSNINHLIPLLKNLNVEKLNIPHIEAYINEIIKPVQIKQNTAYNAIQLNLLTDMTTIKNFPEVLLDFYIEIYRISRGEIKVIPQIKSLLKQYQSLKNDFFEKLLTLRNTYKLNLQPFFDYLIEMADVNEKLFDLYERLFSLKDMQETKSDKIKNKLNVLINTLIVKNDEHVEKLIVNLIKNKLINPLLIDIVTSKTPDEMVQLPTTIKHIAFDYLCEKDKIFTLEENIEAIKDIASFNSKYNDCILKIVKSKLPNSEKVPDAIEIINAMQDLSEDQIEEILRELKSQRKHETHGEEVKALIKKLSPRKITSKEVLIEQTEVPAV